jgi:hypothetical protein
MFKDTDVMTNIYQMVVLGAVIILNIMVFFKTGELNEILTGAMIGVMIGIPAIKK